MNDVVIGLLAFVLAAVLAWWAFAAIKSGTVSENGFGPATASRKRKPLLFWFWILLYGTMSAMMMFAAGVMALR